MAKKIALKLDYESPFTAYSIFSTQKDYRTAWLINEHLVFELERIIDYPHRFSETKTGNFPLYFFDYKQFRTKVLLLGNKNTEGPIIADNPVPDFLLLLINASEFLNKQELLVKLRKITQFQTVACLNEKTLKKNETFFYDLEFFLTEQSII